MKNKLFRNRVNCAPDESQRKLMKWAKSDQIRRKFYREKIAADPRRSFMVVLVSWLPYRQAANREASRTFVHVVIRDLTYFEQFCHAGKGMLLT